MLIVKDLWIIHANQNILFNSNNQVVLEKYIGFMITI